MRTPSWWWLALCAVAAILTVACADADDPLLTGPTGQVEITTAPITFPGITGATYAITVSVFDSGGKKLPIYTNPDVSTDDYGTSDGRIVFIAPCTAGDTVVSVELKEVRTSTGPLIDAHFPPPVDRTIECEENADVRANFVLTFMRRAQQGFADIVVQIQDFFCSYKVSCEEDLMAEPTAPYAPGPTLVTGFACTDGEPFPPGTNYVGFRGELCCYGALIGDPSCSTLTIDPAHGGPIWNLAPGVLDARSYHGEEAILGKVFHNTSWRVDPTVDDCVFYGFGFFNWEDEDDVKVSYKVGGNGQSPAPAAYFEAYIDAIDPDSGAMTCHGTDVEIGFGPHPPDGPGEPGQSAGTAYAYGGAGVAICFGDVPGVRSNNWGWTNGPISPAAGVTHTYDLYLGAGRCDLNKGTHVGTMSVAYEGETLTATLAIAAAGLQMDESHLYVGADMVPTTPGPNGKPTVAPGQYPYANKAAGTEHTYTVSGLTGAVYVIGHAAISAIGAP